MDGFILWMIFLKVNKMLDKSIKPNPENIIEILNNLKKTILNCHTSEVEIAMKYFREFISHPEYWAINWKDKK